MPARIDPNLCDGCRGTPEPPCVRVCPGDIVAKDFTLERSFLRCAAECWDCYACVKVCPRNAIQVELPYAIARRSGALRLADHSARGVTWEIHWPDGRVQALHRPAHVEAFEEVEEPEADLFAGRGI